MATIESRLERIENETRFRTWVRAQRMLEDMNVQEMKDLAVTGQWPQRPDPAPGASRLDTIDRATLLKMWKDDQLWYAGRNNEELVFFADHGHWTEQTCERGECEKLR